ncbi:unnamed protein product [Gongylonema pulchrum]|uniref:LEM domain-containing protein n=1 Tax=Gongylonema pulchrum TaxID=637853 RepID=A0A183D5W3_9BILA|nr:unnamed protein product [Gongylonema pulchrum]
MRAAVNLEQLCEASSAEDLPPPPAYIHKRAMPEAEVLDDSAAMSEKLKETFGIQEEDAQKIITSLNVSHLALLNKRDIFFRKKVDREDIPADTELQTLKLKRKVLEMFNPIKKKPLKMHHDPQYIFIIIISIFIIIILSTVIS